MPPQRRPSIERPDPPEAARTGRGLLAWSLLAALLLLGAMAAPFFARRVYTRDDLGAFHLPVGAFYAAQLARGEPFDWMPQLFSGFYLTGEGQAGTYHPLHWLLYRFLPFRAAAGWTCLLPYPVMLAGTYFFLRRRLRRRDAAMFGGLLFTFSGFNLLHFIHPNAIAVVAHLPWLLWAIDVVLVDSLVPRLAARQAVPGPRNGHGFSEAVAHRRVAAAQVAIALLTGSQLLLGYPQYVWFSLLAEAAYATFVLANHCNNPTTPVPDPHPLRSPSPPWLALLIAKGCGLLIGGVQLLPTVDALAHSARRWADAGFADAGSLHPLNLLQLVAPYLFANRVVGQNTHELGLYAGAVPVMLIVWLVVRRRHLGELSPLVWAAGGFGLLSLLLALGSHAPLYRFQTMLPLVGSFRFPCRYIVLFHLATAVMAAVGFLLLVRDHRRHRDERSVPRLRSSRARRRFAPLWAVVALGVVVAAVGLVLRDRPWIAPTAAVVAGPLLLAAAATLTTLAARGFRAALVGLILLAAADLGVYGLSYAVYPHNARLEQFVASTVTPPVDRPGRVMASPVRFDEQRLRMGNELTLAGWHRADGYAGLEPHRRLDYRCLPALRAAGVRWIVRSEATEQIAGLIPYDEHWLEVPDPLPRVRLVGRVRPSDDPARDIARISLESTALTGGPLTLADAPPGTVTILDEQAGRLHVRCRCPGPQLLVFAEGFHPGWQARVDGREEPVLRVNGDFLGCMVGPGSQQILFEFRPRSLWRGAIASCSGLVLALAWAIGRRSRPPVPSPSGRGPG